MIYLDTSVALAQLLGETRRPPDEFWQNSFVSSRLLEYEIWTRIHADHLTGSHSEAARSLIGRVALVELSSIVLERIADGFPLPVRTLDAIHLATILHMMGSRQPILLATYDMRLAAAAERLGVRMADAIG